MFGLKRKEGLIRADNMPSQGMFSAAKEFTKFTPDYGKLERHEFQLLFVCDEMLKGHRLNHELNEDAVFMAAAFTQDKFTLWKKQLGRESFAVPLENDYSTVMSTRLKGEIYAIRPRTFLDLDFRKENGVQYLRKRITLDVPFRQVYWQKDGPEGGGVHVTQPKVQHVKAWAYVGLPDYWDEQIDGGLMFKPVQMFYPKKIWEAPYYSFTTIEYHRDTEGIQSRLR